MEGDTALNRASRWMPRRSFLLRAGFATAMGVTALGAPVTAHATAVQWGHPFTHYRRISSGYGVRNGRMHHGVDYPLGGTARPEIRAVADGTVYGVGWHTNFGWFAEILHANGWTSFYAHMRSASPLGANQRVARGQFVGMMGNTGAASQGDHLHIELRTTPGRWDVTTDPYPYIHSAPLPGQNPITFTDIDGHVFQNEILWLANNGISRGWEVAPNVYEFRPQNQILRGEMAAFLYRLAGQPTYTPSTVSPFVDVPTWHVFYKEISWLASTGISRGWATPNGIEFRPEWPTTREVMAAFLHRFEGSPGFIPTGASPFQDVQPGIVFYNEILWLASEGISTGWDVGYGCREYRPGQNVLRSEMAAFLHRMTNGGSAPVTADTCAAPP